MLDYDGCHNSVLKALNIHSSSSPMHAFSHAIYHNKSNLIKWRTLSMNSIDVEIQNIELEISNLEINEAASLKPWIQTWLKALYNSHNELLRQNTILWAQRAKM